MAAIFPWIFPRFRKKFRRRQRSNLTGCARAYRCRSRPSPGNRSSESEIPTQAKAVACDLIVVGTHAAGLALLLGSTTDGVMHGAECDVLAVKVDADA